MVIAMISWQEGKEIAAKELEYPMLEIWDLGDKWVYVFDAGRPAAPGMPLVSISKDEGKVGYITIPPLENIGILDEGKLIYRQDYKKR